MNGELSTANARVKNDGVVAVMDLGTNTFHLLIARIADGEADILLRESVAVKLGEDGLSKGFIQPNAFERGVKTMSDFASKIKKFEAVGVKAVATSMLRNAANGKEFISEVKAKAGICIELVDGQQEAAYIYQGVKASGCLSYQHSLIMDIGGGSVEFILCTSERILWMQSFEIGALRLMERFHTIDPISTEAKEEMYHYLDGVLQPLFAATQNRSIDKLIGSSGAFETFAELISLKNGADFNVNQTKSVDFDLRDFINTTNLIIRSFHAERAQMKGIIPLRVDMIVVASLLTRYVMQKLGIQNTGMSTYSLKEGVLAELMPKR